MVLLGFLDITIDDAGYRIVPGIGNYGVGIVIEVLLECRYLVGDTRLHIGILLRQGNVTLDHLDCVPPDTLVGNLSLERGFGDRNRCLHPLTERYRFRYSLVVDGLSDLADQFIDTYALQSGHRDDGASQFLGQALHVYAVALFLDDIHHVECDDGRYSRIQDLEGEVEVPLQVGRIDYVQDRIGTLLYEEVPRNDLLRGVR